jgi:hypothetical protein
MKSASTVTHSVRMFGLWAVGGAAAYLIVRELTRKPARRKGAGPTTPSTMPERDLPEMNVTHGSEAQLDAAVDATFPASDPYSMQFE